MTLKIKKMVYAGTAIAAIVVSSVVATQVAIGVEPSGDDSDAPGWMTPSDEWAESVTPYTDALIDAAIESGQYSSEWIDYDTSSFVVIGTGDAPASIVALFDDAPEGLAVSWQSARFSDEDLQEAIDEILAAHPTYSAMWGGGTASDFDSVTIMVAESDLKGTSLAGISRVIASETTTDVPFTVQVGPAVSGLRFDPAE